MVGLVLMLTAFIAGQTEGYCTQMWVLPHVNTHTHLQTCSISGDQLK